MHSNDKLLFTTSLHGSIFYRRIWYSRGTNYSFIILNYSEPFPIHSQNRAFHALSRCFAANFAHIWGGNSIRVTLSNLINCFLHASMTNQFTKFDKKIYSSYKNEDYFLEGLQVRLEDILKELENYKCI